MNSHFFLSYEKSTRLQHELVSQRIRDKIGDLLFFVEHEPVITLGSSARTENLLLTPEEYKSRGIQVVKTDRGGDVTFHGPGQLVLYPIMKLTHGERDPHQYLHNLEEVVISTLKSFNITGFRVKGKTGAWTKNGKIAAVGVYLKRWVTYHGLALNINPDLSGFESIIPCGLQDRRISTIAHELFPAPSPTMETVSEALTQSCRNIFKKDFLLMTCCSPIASATIGCKCPELR